ncbi:MAG: helix-turn-helix transcriptional regulator [Actinobacteria bacterium]|nr:helix-turn-helix transcriptional regulator [Actinomycetota bacterium]
MPRPRKQLDFRAAAAALTAPGAEGATMAAIARRLDVAKPTLYRMAGSREELVQLCVDAEAERLLEQLHRAGGVAGFLAFAEDSPAGFLLLFGGRHAQARQAVRRVENRLGDELQRRGVPQAHAAAAGLLGLAAAVARRALEDGVPLESLDLQAILVRMSSEGN